MIALDERTNTTPPPLPLLEEILAYLGGGDVELLIVDDEEMRAINHEYRGVDSTTDVLSFPINREANPHLPLGSIVISFKQALKLSKELGHSLENEIALLFVHGLLHLLGFDHEQDQGEHRHKEQEVIEHFNLPESLIIRTENHSTF